MFKHLKATFLASVGVAVFLTSCTSDETIGVVAAHPGERQEIEFSLDMMSRGTDRTIANLDTIWVYADDGAAEVFPATAFIKNEYGYFKPKTKIYWPDDKENLNFTAFWPSPDRLNLEKCSCASKKDTHQKLTFTPGDVTLANEILSTDFRSLDVITATRQMNKDDYKGSIALNFAHALTQIDFKVKQNPTADHRIDIYGYQLNINNSHNCIYSFNDGVWSLNPDNTGSYSITGIPEAKIRVGEEPVSILNPKNGNIYVHPWIWDFFRFDLKSGSTTSNMYLMLYAKVYDEKGKILYPTDTTKNGPQLIPVFSVNVIKNSHKVDLTGCGCIYIQLGKESFTPEAGHKYVFNIDFTFGAGYYFQEALVASSIVPILKNPICADVTVEDWTSTELDDMEQN